MENIKRRIDELREEIYDLESQIEDETSEDVTVKISIQIDNLWSDIAQLEDELGAAIEEFEEDEEEF